MTRPLLLGHRGARADKTIPENTFASFDRAMAEGCDGFEFDVRLTADRQAVICHDPEIGKLQIASAKAEQLSGLPRFEDVLARYRHAFLDIELKVPGLERIVVEPVRKVRLERFVISSFLPELLKTLHALDPGLPLGLICETETQLQRWPKLPVQHVIPHYKLARLSLIRQLHEAGKKVMVWTVNRPGDMKQFTEWGVDGIISDDAKLLGQTFVPT
jgi:glycerophosphoryl diester phosphodiesterase